MNITNTIRPIRSEQDYDAALERIDALMDAQAGTPELDELEVLATLVELYEEKHYPIDLPDPIEAIKFRMDQSGFSMRDIVPLIGSRGKVSEVLSGKRPLTLKMIRALHEHLGIPAEILLKQPGALLPETPAEIDWSKFPFVAMAKVGWIEKRGSWKDCAEEIMRDLIERAGGKSILPQVLYRKNDGARQNAKVDPYAMQAWCLQLMAIAHSVSLPVQYQEGSITLAVARELVKQSWSESGPRLAREYLASLGIHLIYLPHLPKTYLDGAALKLSHGAPVIGLTLRYDRLDNFWFSLCHELAHVVLHLQGQTDEVIFDDLSLDVLADSVAFDRETEADQWTEEVLIPSDVWEESRILDDPSPLAVVSLARNLGINPAIVAGRIRKELNNYRLLTHYVGRNEVKTSF